MSNSLLKLWVVSSAVDGRGLLVHDAVGESVSKCVTQSLLVPSIHTIGIDLVDSFSRML